MQPTNFDELASGPSSRLPSLDESWTASNLMLRGFPAAYPLERLKTILRAKCIEWRQEPNLLELQPVGKIIYGTGNDLPAGKLAELLDHAPSSPESLSIAVKHENGEPTLVLVAADQRGLSYALYEAARAIELNGSAEDPFQGIDTVHEEAELTIRSAIRTMMNRELDITWLNSGSFWSEYLDMLVATRHNRFKLSIGWRSAYFSPPYPYLVEVPGYRNVSVTNIAPQERAANLAMLQMVSAMAKDRGLEFYLDTYWLSQRPMGDWAEARRYVIEGLRDEDLADYTCHGIETLLRACPHIDGIGLSGSMVENGVTQELMNAFFDGIANGGRPMAIQIELKGVNQELVDQAKARGIEVTLGGKYCMEHKGLPYHPTQIRLEELGESRDLLAIHTSGRRWTRNSYADMLYHPRKHDFMFNLWNWGTQKVLLWGDAEDVARLARNSKIAGSLGLEHGDPLTYKGSYSSGPRGQWSIFVDSSLENGRWEFERYWLHYLLYGRLMYNSHTPAEVWRREFVQRFGEKAAEPLMRALAQASKTTPLMTMVHAPSASDNSYWPEIYTNIPITTPDPMRRDGGSTFGECGPSDTALFYRIDDYVRLTLQGGKITRYSPSIVRDWFLSIGQSALSALDEADVAMSDPNQPEFRATSIDIKIQAHLALFFAHKLDAATAFSFYREAGTFSSLMNALAAYELALAEWRQIVEITEGVYQPNLAFHRNPIMSGSWSDRVAAIVADIEQMRMFKDNYLALYADCEVSFGHLPVRNQQPSEIEVETSIKGWQRIRKAFLYYRLAGMDSFVSVQLMQELDCPPQFKAQWNVPSNAKSFDYYFEAFLDNDERRVYPLGGAATPLMAQLGEAVAPPFCAHTPPASFRHAAPLPLTLVVKSAEVIENATLHFRHVNQSEFVISQEMAPVDGAFHAVIPAEYTNSRYDLMYYFSVNDRIGNSVLYPGLEGAFDAPYFVVAQELEVSIRS